MGQIAIICFFMLLCVVMVAMYCTKARELRNERLAHSFALTKANNETVTLRERLEEVLAQLHTIKETADRIVHIEDNEPVLHTDDNEQLAHRRRVLKLQDEIRRSGAVYSLRGKVCMDVLIPNRDENIID